MHRFTVNVFKILVLMMVTGASGAFSDENVEREVAFSGVVSITEGQFLKGHHKQKPYEHRPWHHMAISQLRLDAYVGERIHIIVAPEVKLWGAGQVLFEIVADVQIAARARMSRDPAAERVGEEDACAGENITGRLPRCRDQCVATHRCGCLRSWGRRTLPRHRHSLRQPIAIHTPCQRGEQRARRPLARGPAPARVT